MRLIGDSQKWLAFPRPLELTARGLLKRCCLVCVSLMGYLHKRRLHQCRLRTNHAHAAELGVLDPDETVQLHPPARVFSVDVECIATGLTHERSSRAACEVALVDGWGRLLLHSLIIPERPIVSYLTPFTGLRPGDLDQGKGAIPYQKARALLRRLLRSDAVLVGQNPVGDVEWMGLEQGTDFERLVDLAEIFATDDGTVFSLHHQARVLLGKRSTRKLTGHDPIWDASVSVELYQKAAAAMAPELETMREAMTAPKNWPPLPSIAHRCGYTIDGVCLSMYSAENCTCGRPLQHSIVARQRNRLLATSRELVPP